MFLFLFVLFWWKEFCFVFFKEGLQLAFVTAEFLLTTRAIEALVCRGREPFGVDVIGEFPANEKQECEAKEGIGVYTRNEDEWGEHHCKIPVVDATGGATSIFHNPGLERTEKEDADDVADGKADGNQNEDTTVEQTEKIEKANDTVQGKPKQCDKGGNLPGLVLW